MTYSAVGSPVTGITFNATLSSFTVNPTAIGDVLVIFGYGYNGSYGANFVPSGGGVTTWVHAASAGINNPGAGPVIVIWYGVVMSTGSQTLTILGGTTQYTTAWIVQQFHCTVSGAWGWVSNSSDNGPGTTVTSGNFGLGTPLSDGIYLGLVASNNSATFADSSVGFTFTQARGGMLESVYDTTVASPNSYNPAWVASVADYVGSCSSVISVTVSTSPTFIVMIV